MHPAAPNLPPPGAPRAQRRPEPSTDSEHHTIHDLDHSASQPPPLCPGRRPTIMARQKRPLQSPSALPHHSMTAAAAGPQPAITAKPGANPAPTTNSSPARRNKELPNPQQGMADGTNAAGGGVTSNNTACTSPLTVTSLEAAAAATATAGVPQVVSQVVPTHSQPPQSKPASTVESMLGKLSLNHPVQQQQPPVPHRPMEDKKMRLRTPPTERDCRKLFVGGLPTDGEKSRPANHGIFACS